MSKIKLKVQMSGTRNGEDWPAPGSVVDLPAEESAQLVSQGCAAELEEDEPAIEFAVAPSVGVEKRAAKP